MSGQLGLLNIACAAKAKCRTVTVVSKVASVTVHQSHIERKMVGEPKIGEGRGWPEIEKMNYPMFNAKSTVLGPKISKVTKSLYSGLNVES